MDSSALVAEEVYTALFGAQPDVAQRNKVPGTRFPFLSLAEGRINSLDASVRINPGRLDLVVSEADEPDVIKVGRVNTPEVISLLMSRLTQQAMESIGPVVRVSIIASLAKPEENYGSAANEIFELCGMQLRWDGHSDLQFQINKRMNLNSGFQANRIMRYAVEAQQVVQMQIDLATGLQTAGIPFGKETFAVQLQLDFNTVQDGRVLGASVQKQVFEELASEILRVADAKKLSALEDK